MNITSSAPLLQPFSSSINPHKSNPYKMQDLRQSYLSGLQRSNSQRLNSMNANLPKSKSSIRIKNKINTKDSSQLKSMRSTVKSKTNGFKIKAAIQHDAIFINTARKVAEIEDDCYVMGIDQETNNSSKSIRKELLFLREIIKKKKCDSTQGFVSQFDNYPTKVDNQTLRTKSRSSKQIEDHDLHKQKLLQGHSLNNNGFNAKFANDYEHYDMVVRDLLSEFKVRKNKEKESDQKKEKKRPLISPSKYNEAKIKILSRLPAQTQFCNFKGLIKISNNGKKDSMIFRMQQQSTDNVYQRKITSYILFLYKINFSNSVYADMSLTGKMFENTANSTTSSTQLKKDKNMSYKVRIGSGNNCSLVKALIKRRFWLEIVSGSDQKVSFIWTQGTNEACHNSQKCSQQKTQELLKKQSNPFGLKRYGKKQMKPSSEDYCNNKIFIGNSFSQYSDAQRHFYICNNGAYSSLLRNIKPELISNHIPHNYIIGSKKVLFILIAWYYEHIKKDDPFKILPKTYHIGSGGNKSNACQDFLDNEGSDKQSTWIVKPGQNTNRGVGITVASLTEVSKLIRKKQVHRNGEQKTYIIQKYLKPFLYNGRKFDIRHYLLITSVNGYIKGYWYKQGYLRTSSEKYDLEDLSNQFVHLTNDAIQKKSQFYGKYEPGNKVSYQNFQRYLDQVYPHKKYSFQKTIVSSMKKITRQLMQASFLFLDPSRKQFNFQLYGMDFMVDNKFNTYLIQVNANPCLETSCPLLERIVPVLLEHTFRIGLDPLLPPPQHYPVNARYQLSDRILEKLNYQVIFDQRIEGQQLKQQICDYKDKFIQKLKDLSSQKSNNIKNKQNIEQKQSKQEENEPIFKADEEIYDNDGQERQNIDIE